MNSLALIGLLYFAQWEAQPTIRPLDAGALVCWNETLNVCLDAVGATDADLDLRSDLLTADPLLLPEVARLLHPTAALPDRTNALAGRLLDAATPSDMLSLCRAQLVSLATACAAASAPTRMSAAQPSLPAGARLALTQPLPAAYAQLIRQSAEVLSVAHHAASQTATALTSQERQLLAERLPATLARSADPHAAPATDGLEEASRQRELVSALRRVNVAGAMEAARLLLDIATPWTALEPLDATGPQGVLLDQQTAAGRLLVMGAGDDIITLDSEATLVVDLGGNDIVIDRAPLAPGMARLHIDLGGDDRYLGTVGGAGAALLGAAVLLDNRGNDTYDVHSSGCGAALAGVGILWDRDGHDLYNGSTGVQAAAIAGVGLLIDEQGNDRYLAQTYAQGFGGPGGLGILLDRQGKDVYVAGYHHPDKLKREPPGYSTMAQGFGLGLRPYCAGGLGVLLDVAGDDAYRCDYFGQGAGYWLAAGLLADVAGHDEYHGNRYCQGAGVHLAIGALLDGAGNDAYASWGVSQGVGHDLALGLLMDGGGNDRYRAAWMALGAGNSNGVGIAFDAAGDDDYARPAEWSVAGFGNFVADRADGSFGLALDAGGLDRYQHRGGNESWWGGGLWGIALDWTWARVLPDMYVPRYPDHAPPQRAAALPIPPPWPRPPAPVDPELASRVYALLSADVAATDIRAQTLESLLALGPPVADALMPYLGHEDVHVAVLVADTLDRLGSAAAPALRRVVQAPADTEQQRLALHALGKLGHPEDIPVFASFLTAGDWRFRALAARGIGAATTADTRSTQRLLYPLLRDADRSVRRWAVYALGSIGDAEAAIPLADRLADDAFRIRRLTADALAAIAARGATDSIRSAVRPYLRPDWPAGVRAAAWRILAAAGRRADRAAAQRAATDPAPAVRAAAYAAWKALDPKKADKQLARRQDPHPYAESVRRELLAP